MSGTDSQRVYNYPIYPRDSKIYSDKGFVNIDKKEQGGTDWTQNFLEDKKSCYFDSFARQPFKFLLKQLTKSQTQHN